jgi:TRAP-type C4-dicarboxylate transport system permease large subunit
MGAIEVKAMLDAKYDRAFVAAVTAASAVVGPIIPPSIIFASLPIGLALMAWYALRLAVQAWRSRSG